MVSVRKMVQEGRVYYYIVHPIKIDGKTKMRSKYIGKTIPLNLESLKKDFLIELENDRWSPHFEKIRASYESENERFGMDENLGFDERAIVNFAINSQAISGSKVTFSEFSKYKENGSVANGADYMALRETLSQANVLKSAPKTRVELEKEMIIEWHWNIFRETKPDLAGLSRPEDKVRLDSTWPFLSYLSLDEKMDALIDWYNEKSSKLNPAILAGLFHVLFYGIGYFQIGNGRLSRLAMNYILLKNNYPILAVRFNERVRYRNALSRSLQQMEEYEFLKWFCLKYKRRFSNGSSI